MDLPRLSFSRTVNNSPKILGISPLLISSMCRLTHKFAKKGFYASVGELGDDMRQEN